MKEESVFKIKKNFKIETILQNSKKFAKIENLWQKF